MKTIAFYWELEAGGEHVGKFSPLLRKFLESGWGIVLIVRDLSRPGLFLELDDDRPQVFQSPHKTFPRSAAHVMPVAVQHGLSHPQELQAVTAAWRNLFDAIKPDLVVAGIV